MSAPGGGGIAGVLPPTGLPGDFYVLEYDKNTEWFKLYSDDENQSSYELGELTPARRYLGLFGGPDADLAMDYAMQFGVVQVIPAQRRVILLHNRSVRMDLFAKANHDACHSLPRLR